MPPLLALMPPLITRPAPIAAERVQTTSALSKIQGMGTGKQDLQATAAAAMSLSGGGWCLETGVGRHGRRRVLEGGWWVLVHMKARWCSACLYVVTCGIDLIVDLLTGLVTSPPNI